MITKRLGKITRVAFGFGGYQDDMIGVRWEFGGEGWATATFEGDWVGARSEGVKWTEEDRLRNLGTLVMRLSSILLAAKKSDLSKMVDVAIEAKFEDRVLVEWRVLTEVL